MSHADDCTCSFCRIRKDLVLPHLDEEADMQEAFEASGGGSKQEFEEFKAGWTMHEEQNRDNERD